MRGPSQKSDLNGLSPPSQLRVAHSAGEPSINKVISNFLSRIADLCCKKCFVNRPLVGGASEVGARLDGAIIHSP